MGEGPLLFLSATRKITKQTFIFVLTLYPTCCAIAFRLHA